MQTRRSFIGNGAKLAASAFLPSFLEDARTVNLTVLHTNDVHSMVDPIPMDGSKYQGLGGLANRAAIINRIRQTEEHVLLLDAGDIFQGTPYFNFFKGETEIKAMAAMGYDATTMGNHDFDLGIDNFAHQLSAHGNFPLIICNYDFTGTPLQHNYLPYKIFRKGPLKIGVLGVGIEMKGLVPDNLTGGTVYLDPLQQANKVAAHLKEKERCDLVICLSHLGDTYAYNKVSDAVLARESAHIDLIIGGHTHTFMNTPKKYVNKYGGEVIVNQVGWGGVILGRLDFSFSRISGKRLVNTHTVPVEENPSE